MIKTAILFEKIINLHTKEMTARPRTSSAGSSSRLVQMRNQSKG